MKQNNLEIKVGSFVIFGLLLLGGLLVIFGRLERLTQTTYDLHVELPNASGLLKNSQVLYRGAKVGAVSDKPRISEDGTSVTIDLQIYSGIKIDQGSRFKVGVNGLLGDRFVDVLPPSEPGDAYFEAGATVKGEKTTGIADLGEKMEPILKKLDSISYKISEELLTEEFVNDVHSTVKSARSVMARMDSVLTEAQKGKTPLGAILYDKTAAEQIKQMVSDMSGLAFSLRKEGVLFYKDVSEAGQKEKEKQAADKVKSESKPRR